VRFQKDLNRVIDDRLNPTSNPFRGFPTSCPEVERLLFCAPSDSYEACNEMLNLMNIMSALLLNSLLTYAFAPLDITSLPEEKRALGRTFNFLMILVVTLAAMLTMISTFVGVLVASVRTSSIHRVIVNSSFFVLFPVLNQFQFLAT
jgi:hypothetical protein